jgi:riboflavin kinase / FMN adenylyltransferase
LLVHRLSAAQALAQASIKGPIDEAKPPAFSAGSVQKFKAVSRAMTIGNFDGVHVGHQNLIRALIDTAQKAAGSEPVQRPLDLAKVQSPSLITCALSFEPHPREFFARSTPALETTRITNVRNKLKALALTGIDEVCLLRFDQLLSSLSPSQFVENILVNALNCRVLLVGDDFRFGNQRQGDFNWLAKHAPQWGIEVSNIGSVLQAQSRISSSLVRKALAEGNFAEAKLLLGRPYAIDGHVIHGRKLGRQWGFPTLNIPLGPNKPSAKGIFVTTVHGLLDENGQPCPPQPSVASLGTRPVVETNGRYLLEVFLLGWSGNAYGQRVSVEFHHRLRDELALSSVEALKAQIALDVQQARDWHAQEH